MQCDGLIYVRIYCEMTTTVSLVNINYLAAAAASYTFFFLSFNIYFSFSPPTAVFGFLYAYFCVKDVDSLDYILSHLSQTHTYNPIYCFFFLLPPTLPVSLPVYC